MTIHVKMKLRRHKKVDNLVSVQEQYGFSRVDKNADLAHMYGFSKSPNLNDIKSKLGILKQHEEILGASYARVTETRSSVYGKDDPRRVLSPVRSATGSNGTTQSEENTVLLKWAEERGKLNAASVFMDKWYKQTENLGKPIKGQEHLVLFNNQTVEKAKYLWPQDSWAEVLSSKEKHNAYFPGTPYTFLNFSEPHKDGLPLMAVYSQPAITGKPSDYNDVANVMLNKGFIPVRHVPANTTGLSESLAIKWWNPINNDIVSDLGARNVLNVNGKLAFIDPNIDTVNNVPGLRERIISTVTRQQIDEAINRQSNNGMLEKSLSIKDNIDPLAELTIANDTLRTYEHFYRDKPELAEQYKEAYAKLEASYNG